MLAMESEGCRSRRRALKGAPATGKYVMPDLIPDDKLSQTSRSFMLRLENVNLICKRQSCMQIPHVILGAVSQCT